jgi:NAD(P)-dependent dehydrogenase (short-subunit alcohol dehydrogenase family)
VIEMKSMNLASARRGFLTAAASMGAWAATTAQANTRQPPQPAIGLANARGRFAGQVVLVTGGNAGIGEATARAFAMEGARVAFNGRREALGREVERSISERGGQALYVRSDVRDEAQMKAFADAVLARWGRIDIAFNNAGIAVPRPLPLHEQPLQVWEDIYATNVRGVFLSMKVEIPPMLKQGSGVIINMASVGAYLGYPTIGPYGSSKAAVVQMTRHAAREYGSRNIRVVSISPGGVDTDMRRKALSDQGRDPQSPPPNIPQRITTVEEMARTVMFLASDEASAITGTDIDVTAGQMT